MPHSKPATPKRRLPALLLAAGAALALAGAAHGAELKEVKIALPFPNGVAYPYFSVAQELGYAAAEGLKIEVVITDGSGASYKALASNSVDFAFTQPAQILNGMALGEDIVSVYTAYQGHVYQFVTLDDGKYQHVKDLKGTKIGISSVAGGQYAYLKATLKNAGLSIGPGADVEIAEVGRGGAAAVALQEHRISSYSASFVDMMAIEQKGIKIRQFREGPTASFFSDSLAARKSVLDKDPKTAIGVARAIAKGTAFCMANVEACWAIIAKAVPDTAKKPDFTKPLLGAVLKLHALPDWAKGKWGDQSAEAWQAVEDYLIDSEQLKKRVDVKAAFTDRYIAEINKFDAAKLAAAAKAYKE
jgi:NitT/TauT family transport system substrate-binding protein